jgi:hypothetical protein
MSSTSATNRRLFLAHGAALAAVPAVSALVGGALAEPALADTVPAADTLPDYAPIPPSALGPAVNGQGYFVGRVKRNLYWVIDGTYQAAFLTTKAEWCCSTRRKHWAQPAVRHRRGRLRERRVQQGDAHRLLAPPRRCAGQRRGHRRRQPGRTRLPRGPRIRNPAVVETGNATQRLHTGQLTTVDGTTGPVIVHTGAVGPTGGPHDLARSARPDSNKRHNQRRQSVPAC